MSTKKGIDLIAKEREDQQDDGYTIDHDYKVNDNGQLAYAARMLLSPTTDTFSEFTAPTGWNGKTWLQLCAKPFEDRLVIAGALAAAERDRLEKIKYEHEKELSEALNTAAHPLVSHILYVLRRDVVVIVDNHGTQMLTREEWNDNQRAFIREKKYLDILTRALPYFQEMYEKDGVTMSASRLYEEIKQIVQSK